MSRTTEYTTPLSGTPYYTNTGVIKCYDENGSHFPVGEISYERFDDQNFQYVITPYWDEITQLPSDIFYDILLTACSVCSPAKLISSLKKNNALWMLPKREPCKN